MVDTRFICKKCDAEFRQMPNEHGLLFSSIYPNKPKPIEKCNGEVVLIETK